MQPPRQLLAYNNWVAFKLVPSTTRPGKTDKIPISPFTGGKASTTDPATWGSFQSAVDRAEFDNLDGVGFVFTGTPYAGTDLDGCVGEDEEPTLAAWEVIGELNSYAELSPSGHGVHVIVEATLPKGRRRNDKIEMYDTGRFFTFTGNQVDGTPDNVEKRQAEIETLHARVFAMMPTPQAAGNTQQPLPVGSAPVMLPDAEVVRLLVENVNAPEIVRLYGGDWTGYPSQSEADMALCSHLAFYTGRNADQMDRLFRQSGLYRAKWDKQHGKTTYGEMTIEQAANTAHNTYSPLGPNGNGNGNARDPLVQHGADDDGNSQTFLELFPDTYMYCDAFGWLTYNGRYWQSELAEALLDRQIIEMLHKRRKAAVNVGADHIMKFCTPSAHRKRGCKDLLQSYVAVAVSEFNSDIDLLNCRNGVVNLRTGAILPHSPTQRFTYCVQTDYIPGADSTTWERWLLDTINGNSEVADYIQMSVGYSLTGHTSEECLFYLFGPPRSGKGTFTQTILTMLGHPLSTECDFSVFTEKRSGDSQNFDLAGLKATRFLSASESSKYQSLNAKRVKSITGGDPIRCAHKHREFFSYRPEFKMWLSSNEMVNADVSDDAIWGRVHVIEFPNSHLDDEDKGLKHSMLEPVNLEGILAWAIKGARRWYQAPKGIQKPATVTNETKRHREENDYIAQFIDDLCELDPAHFVPNGVIYPAYEEWCKENGVTPMKQRSFSRAMLQKGHAIDKQWVPGAQAQMRGVVGLKLK